jgi:hypothetical protein
MSDQELKQLVESNARAIQAMLDSRVEERLEFQSGMDQLREVVVRLANLQEGMTRMLVDHAPVSFP